MTSSRRAAPILALAVGLARPPVVAAQEHGESAHRVLATVPLVDGHNDLAWTIRERVGEAVLARGAEAAVAAYDLRARTPGHTDLDRLRRGRVGAQVWSVYVPCGLDGAEAARVQREQVEIARAVVAAHPETFRLATTADDLERAFAEGRIGSMLGMEGAHTLEGSVAALRAYRDLGVRSLGLTHNCSNEFADAALGARRHGGLSEAGRALVREMNRLGVLVDLAHASPATMRDALDVSTAPVVFSHAAARARVDHPRNVGDDVLRRLSANGGLFMVTFVPAFVSEEHRAWDAEEGRERERLERAFGRGDPRARAGMDAWRRSHPVPAATLAQVADHVEHVRAVAGVEHVGLGSDFDGISRVVRGLEDVATYPALLAELARRGWGDDDLARLAGGNFLRVLRATERVAREGGGAVD